MNPFDVLNSINYTKENLFEDPQSFKEYSAFMVNRGLSYFPDTILYANEMNQWPQIDKDMQYQYFLNSIRPMKRKFQPWQKSKNDENIDCVKTYFGYSNQKAKEALRILTDEQIAEIKRKTDKGG